MAPSAVRRERQPRARHAADTGQEDAGGLCLTLAYRAPLAWDALVARLGREGMPGVDVVEGRRYGRTLRIGTHTGTVFAEVIAGAWRGRAEGHVRVGVAPSLVPALMPLLARLRMLFDLDAEPVVVDAHLAAAGLADAVRRCPGRRAPGAVDGFEIALRLLIAPGAQPHAAGTLAGRVAAALGDPIATPHPQLQRLAPTAPRVARAGASALEALGVPERRARAIVAVADMVARGAVRLEPGGDATAVRCALLAVEGVEDHVATAIVGRALAWPDAFPATDHTLQRAAGVRSAAALLVRAERWRPWRAYAAEHLFASSGEGGTSGDT
jgi:AraC family transcriptional regulator of adaptative response / DNA-3-methyladenine glycosylase II